jgi:hypothetical protein
MDHTRIVAAYGPHVAIQSFNKLVPIGTPCECRGIKTKTWSLAMYGKRRVPVVFVESFQEPVGLHELTIEGLVQVPQRRATNEAHHGKGMTRQHIEFQQGLFSDNIDRK